MSEKTSSVLVKLLFIGGIVALLMVPMAMIRAVVEEREARSHEVAAEVGGTWGGPQRIAGPVLSVPVRVAPSPAESGTFFYRTGRLYLLPDELLVETDAGAVRRHRGIHETVVYDARVRLVGRFSLPPWERLGVSPEALDWSAATVSLSLSDLRGLAANPGLVWDGAPLALEPAAEAALFGRAVEASLAVPLSADGAAFEATLAVHGSGLLDFLPLGRDTAVRMTSDWGDPSFQGAYLPAAPEVTGDGFEAGWSVPHFARGYPQAWLEAEGEASPVEEIHASAFGVAFLLPVDYYQKSERCTKYALLFLALTFGVFFLFELLGDLRLHPVQYLMVGFAMCLFYLLLVAASEHVGFGASYLAAALATVALISGYSAAVLRTRRRAAVLAAALGGLYGVLFVLVQLQTYTLLVGSLGLFAVLAAFMYLTRDVDWYALGQGGRPAGSPAS